MHHKAPNAPQSSYPIVFLWIWLLRVELFLKHIRNVEEGRAESIPCCVYTHLSTCIRYIYMTYCTTVDLSFAGWLAAVNKIKSKSHSPLPVRGWNLGCEMQLKVYFVPLNLDGLLLLGVVNTASRFFLIELWLGYCDQKTWRTGTSEGMLAGKVQSEYQGCFISFWSCFAQLDNFTFAPTFCSFLCLLCFHDC